LRGDGFFTFSLAEVLIGSVQAAFNVLTIVLSGFGFIALVASIFGIVNVMTISVLERRKEIGVLKSLGARDMDIFKIFFLESAVLGFIGWLGGTLLGLFGGFLISTIFKAFINSNSDWKKNLEGLNIDNFSPSFPWWLLLGTLAVALFFTTLSGIFPAIRAGRQNPVEVLRSE
jgi:putative ABC transport system permease protein